jgi:hypothetical protein
MSFRSLVRGAAAPVLLLLCAGSASAGTLVADASSGALAARARFEVQGGNLVITLSNTSTADVLVPADVLTGVYFNITGPTVSLSRVSVVIAAGSSAINVGSQPAGGVVGGEFAYREGLLGPRATAFGVSSSGLGLFGPGDVFAGGNLAGPADPDGLQYGITSFGDDAGTNNGGTSTPLIKNAVVVTLSGLPSGFDPEGRITDINFQYGTALNEPNLLVPTPGSLGLLGTGLILGMRRRRARV